MAAEAPVEKTPQQHIVEALPNQRQIRANRRIQRAERGARAAAGEEALKAGGGSEESFRRAREELRGQLPKLRIRGSKYAKAMDQEVVEGLHRLIWQDPSTRFYEKIRTQEALQHVLAGQITTPSQNRLLRQVFGEETATKLKQAQTLLSKAKHAGWELWNLPRALAASFDLSAPFRQGLVAMAAHPGISFRNFGAMLRAAGLPGTKGGERAYLGIMEQIAERENAKEGIYKKAGLALTGMPSHLAHEQAHEEQFMFSGLGQKLTGGVRGPVAMSDRAYQAYLNKTRADIFDHLYEQALAASEKGEVTDEQARSLAKFVNVATGRGHFESQALEKTIQAANHVMFSPRLFASRVQMLNPAFYAHLDPVARKSAVKGLIGLVSAGTAVLYLASQIPGVKVGLDPRSSDFGKIRIGRTRIDIFGGFQQYVVFAARMLTMEEIVASSGEHKKLRFGPWNKDANISAKDIAERFARSKTNPQTGMLWSAFEGTDYAYKPWAVKKDVLASYIPLLMSDAAKVKQDYGWPAAVGAYGVGMFGFGLSSFGDKPKPGATAPGGIVNAPIVGGAGVVNAGPPK